MILHPTASIVEIDLNPTPKPSKSEKKSHSKPTAEGSATDKLAEALFGGLHRTKEMPKSTASASASASAVHANSEPALLAPAVHSDQPPRAEPIRPSVPLANATPAPPTPAPYNNQPPLTESGQPAVPQQQTMDYLSNPQPPAFGQGREAFYSANYAAYPDAYGGRYVPPECHPPANWGLAPGQGWYPPGPGNPLQPPTSNPPASGPPQHGAYWAPQGPPMYSNPYGHYLAPNVQAARPPQDDPSRTRGNGQAGPSM